MLKKLTLIAVIAAFIVACSSNGFSEKDALAGETIYKTYCVACHGADGKMGVNKAKDLTVSTMTMDQRIEQITNGKKETAMTAYKTILSESEIKQVAAYSMKLSGM